MILLISLQISFQIPSKVEYLVGLEDVVISDSVLKFFVRSLDVD